MARTHFDSTSMGTQPIGTLLIRLSIPAMVGMIVNALYNVVDTIFVGHGVGPLAIAALSIAFPIQMLFGAFAQTFGYGAASIISRRLGEGKPDQAAHAAGNALVGAFSVTALIAVLTYLFSDQIIRFFGATDEILPYTKEYLNVIVLGIPFLAIKMCSNGILRAEGQARASMTFMIIGAVLNSLLDPLFIFVFGMGIKGAALATIISQAVSVLIVSRFFLTGKSSLPLSKSSFIPDRGVIREIVSLGVATFVRQSGTSAISFLVNNLLRLYGGSLAIAAYGMITRLMIFVTMPMFGLVHGFQPIAGYNYGAKNFARVRKVFRSSTIGATLFASICWIFIMLFPSPILRVFTRDGDLLSLASPALRTVTLFLPLVGLQVIGATFFQALGKKFPAIFLTLSRQFIFLVPLLILFSTFFGYEGIWLSFPVAEVLAAAVTTIWVVRELRRLQEMEKHQRMNTRRKTEREII